MDFENTGKHKPISRVTLYIDDEQSYTAGDDTGKEVSAFCPSATQEMVDALLAQLQGYEYQSYTAGDANIDPAAELGDGVTVGGIYSVLSQIDDDGSGYAGIAAPGEAELEEEYPYVGPLEREFNRKMYKAYSLIEKNSERITLEVGELRTYTDGALEELEKEFGTSLSNLESNISVELQKYSTIEMTSSSISSAVSESKTYTDSKTGEVVASLKNYSTIEQTASSISSAVSESKSYTDSSVNSLSSSINTKLEKYSTIEQTSSSISSAVSESKTYTDTKTGQISSQLSNYSTIEQTASSISSAVTESKTYTDGQYEALSTEFEQTAEGFAASIDGLEGQYAEISATIEGLTVTDANGTTKISGSAIETDTLYVNAANITGTLTADQIVLTGAITWGDLNTSVQNSINAGVTSSQVSTMITSSLVSSPNIAGGKFWNLAQSSWLEVGRAADYIRDDNYVLAAFASEWGESAVFSIFRGDRGYATLVGPGSFNFMTLDGANGEVRPYGTWDFSGATIIGGSLAVFG